MAEKKKSEGATTPGNAEVMAPLVTEESRDSAAVGNKVLNQLEKRDSDTTEEESSHEDNQQEEQQDKEEDIPKVTTAPKKPNKLLSVLLTLVRCVLWDTPLAILFGLYMSTLVVDYIRIEYLTPQLELMEWTPDRQMQETTYYHRICDIDDLTATTVEELVIAENQTTDGAVEQMLTHGVAVFPDFMEDDLVDKLRDFVMDRNTKEENFWVIEGEHRYSFGIGANMDPAVSEALNKIATHPTFKPFVEEVVGLNPAVIEFTAITSMPGAKDQFWHADVLPYGSNTKYARSFIPSYSLFIPLQDTTAAMGATQVCPGSHVCSDEPDYCPSESFQVSGSQDNWKKGTAFLFNQAFYHRGTGHSDFNAPARATFIVTFAPRPRFRPGELETRLISQGGSYSLRWDHWGHTLADLKEADKAMVNPWLTLRALGIYKPPNKDWGWDMISVASLRIINDDNGYHDDDLYGFLENGGFKYLPRFLQGSMQSGGPDSTNTMWYDYLTETLHKCSAFLETVNMVVLGTFLVLVAFVDAVMWFRSSKSTKKRRSVLVSSVRRLIITHGLVAAMAWYAVYRVDHTQWAHQIKSGLLYQPALDSDYNDTPETKESIATLPNVHDVLIPARMNSDYLGSYNNFIHVGHPANKEWKTLIANNAEGYSNLPPSLREQVAKGIVDTIEEHNGRFLIQGYGAWGRWVELPYEFAVQRTHREMTMKSHPALKALNQKVDHLLSETRFGYHHRTSLHRMHIPKLLTKLQELIVPDNHQIKKLEGKPRKSGFGPVFKIPKLEAKTTKHKPIGPSMPPHPVGQAPFESAWVKEGDIVEGMYHGSFPEWYKGTVVYASSSEATYNVQYDDGEEDAGLCSQGCVRPFKPYEMDEVVEARMDDDDTFTLVRIAAIHPDRSYDVVADDNQRRRLTAYEIRRGYEEVLEVGSPVQARFQDENEWFAGTITRVRDNGTYDIAYADGDREFEVEKHNIRLVLQ